MIDLTQPPLMYFAAFVSSFIYIFLKSWQQGNVTHRQYWWIPPTSLLMALIECFTISTVYKHGFGWVVLYVGLGGGLGSMSATYLHWKYLVKE